MLRGTDHQAICDIAEGPRRSADFAEADDPLWDFLGSLGEGANRAHSNAEFKSKLGGASQEVDETH